MKSDITGGIKNRKKLKKIQKVLDGLRSKPRNISSSELIKLAKSLGRGLLNRGHEPNYISVLLPNSRPLSIPNHHGAMAIGTAINILDHLEGDIFELEEMLEEQHI